MRQKSEATKVSSEQVVREIRRATRKQYSAEEKIRITLPRRKSASCWTACVASTALRSCAGARGLRRAFTHSWSKEFLEAGKRRLAGDTARAAASSEVKDLRREARELKEVVAEQVLELRLLKKSMIADGGDEE
jgi:transposase